MTDPSLDTHLVWHYTDAGGLLAILRSHTLWATSSAFLNDRQEVSLGGAQMVQRVRRLAEETEDELLVALAERAVKAPLGNDSSGGSMFFILSASQVWDSLAMWRLYGGQQESYAIGLDPSAPLAILRDAQSRSRSEEVVQSSAGTSIGRTPEGLVLRRLSWAPVRYQQHEQDELIAEVVDRLPERVAGLGEFARPEGASGWRAVGSGGHLPAGMPDEVVARLADLLDDLTEALLLVKHPGFVDERETRLAFAAWSPPDDPWPESDLLRYRATSYGIAPYVALTGTADPRCLVTATPTPLPIRAVALSPSPHGPAAEESVRQLLAGHGYGGLPVMRSQIPFRDG